FFFFQAEDGIRDFHVTGVQTCALPICLRIHGPPDRIDRHSRIARSRGRRSGGREGTPDPASYLARDPRGPHGAKAGDDARRLERSEERRVGKEWRGGRVRDRERKKTGE